MAVQPSSRPTRASVSIYVFMKAALSFAVGHSFPLSAHKSCGAVGIERSGGRLRGWNGRGGFLTAASLLSAFISFSARLFISISEAQKFVFFPPQISDYITRSPPLWRPPVCHTRLSSYCLSFIALLICLITLWYQSNLTENAFGRGAERKKTDRQWCSCIFGSIHMFPAFPPPYLMMNMNGQVKWNDDDIFDNTCVWGAAADDNNNNKKKKKSFSLHQKALYSTQFLPVHYLQWLLILLIIPCMRDLVWFPTAC